MLTRADLVRAVKDVRAAETLDAAVDLAVVLLVAPTASAPTVPRRPVFPPTVPITAAETRSVTIVRAYLPKLSDPSEMFFVEESAVVELLAADVLFVNSRRYLCLDDTPQPETLVLFVSCNDLFAWATADAEALPLDEVRALYDAWKAHGTFGVERWCCLKRGQRPQGCVEKQWRAIGAWDDQLEALPARA